MTINQNSSINMTEMFQNSDALTKLSQAKDIAGPVSSDESMAADPAGEAMQALTYEMEGQVMAIQGAVAASIVSLTI